MLACFRGVCPRELGVRIVVFGLGRVGVVTAAGLLHHGHTVVGVDTDRLTSECISRGLVSFQEPDLAELITSGHSDARLLVTENVCSEANADLIIVCVGTPGSADGSLDLSYLKIAARNLGEAVRLRSPGLPPVTLVFRSTMLPDTMSDVVLPAIAEAAGEPAGVRYEVVYNPEFIREGSAVADYFAPSRIVIGEHRPGTCGPLVKLYNGIDAPIFMTSLEVAEFTKFADNSFHALKVAFANEVGRFAIRSDISPAAIFDIFEADTRLNLSASYLRPGGAFGGPCLPKDVRALSARMRELEIDAPVIGRILESNSLHTDFLVDEIERRASPGSRILLIGLSFKTNTDDLRESPLVKLAERLLDRGHNLAICDPDLTYDTLAGVDRPAIAPRLLSILLRQLPASTGWDLIVMGKKCSELEPRFGSGANVLSIDRL
jgi:GDP-mannose 6-dehydrogenase